MNEERPSVLERMTSALAGSRDAEVMGALGAAQMASGRLPAAHARQLAGVVDNGVGGLALITAIGRQLTALQATTSQFTYDQAKQALVDLVTKLNRARRWRLTETNVTRVAEKSLLMHLSPACPHCRGRGWELTPGTQQKGNRRCEPCEGSGHRPYPKRYHEEISATLNVLGLIQGLAERAVTKELG